MTLAALGSIEPGAVAWTDASGGALVRGLGAMAAVLLLILACAWLLRRGGVAFGSGRHRGPITVETAVPIGERRSLVIVAVEGRRLLLGLSPNHVALVTELGAAPFARALEARLPGPESPS
jgi:flagellar protein FliO/FliZ